MIDLDAIKAELDRYMSNVPQTTVRALVAELEHERDISDSLAEQLRRFIDDEYNIPYFPGVLAAYEATRNPNQPTIHQGATEP